MTHAFSRQLACSLSLAVSACASAAHIEKQSTLPPQPAASTQSAIADELALAGRSVNQRTISVLPFGVTTPDTSYAALGYGFAELLLTDLAVSKQLTVLDRMHVEDIRGELALAAADEVDPATAVRAGKLLAANELVLGSLAVPNAADLSFETRVADVETSQLRTALSGHSSLDKLFVSERELVMVLFKELGVTLNKAELLALDERPSPNPQAFVAFSKGVKDEAQGNLRAAAANYDASTAIDPKFTPATVRKQAVVLRAAQSGLTLQRAAADATAESPAEEKSAAEKSAAESPAAEKSAAESPAAEKSAAEKSAAEKAGAPPGDSPATAHPKTAAAVARKGVGKPRAAVPVKRPEP